jgi:TRAP-type C4-dicarboxylate transport system permease small subunit
VTGVDWLRTWFERIIEWLVIVLMVVLFAEVTLGVLFRMAGDPLVWYDEVASVLLAWLTYYASVLAALRRAHIGVPGLVSSFPPGLRVATVVISEGLVIGFFVLLAWLGMKIHDVLTTDFLVSLPEVSSAFTQSVIPIGAALFVIAELLALPAVIAEARGGRGMPDLAGKLH